MTQSTIQYLATNLLQPNPLQPRGAIAPETIMDLVDSISEHGILEPLVVAHTPAGYQIIAGERRWRASKIAGLSEVPCIVRETSPQTMLEMAIVENVQREDLNPIDRAKAFQRLAFEFNLNHAEVAKRIGKSASYISNTVKLLDLPDAIKDGLLTNTITEGHGRALYGIKDKKRMVEIYKQVLIESASVRRTEELARLAREELIKSGNTEIIPLAANRERRNLAVAESQKIQKELKEKLGENSNVRLVRTIKTTTLTIILSGSLDETEPKLKELIQKLS